jgi:glycine/D-amino acid oxidase-like deaminating enzyme/nitrite reductase/ring-hydroxylating ferredoxin subunit
MQVQSMNTGGERSKSLWMELPAPRAPRLTERLTADVIVIGSGIAGISTAYELSEAGLSVIVLDRGPLGRGITSRTTAHLSFANDDGYDEVISKHGDEQARLSLDSQRAAIDRLEEIQRAESIQCDFARIPAFLFAPTNEDTSFLETERDACHKLGFTGVDWSRDAKLAGPYARVLRYPDQARFHPLKYLYGLIAVLKKKGVRFFANSPVISFEEGAAAVTLKTEVASVSGKVAVLATNSPIANRIFVHDKQGPYRTYAFAAEVERGALPDALYWDTEDPYHYVRLQPGKNGKDHTIVGGEDHKTGEVNDAAERFERLEAWGKKYFPMIGKVTHRWSGQVLEPFDYLPFIGKNPGQEKIYIATGDSGQGFTNGPLAGLILAGLIADGHHKWAAMHDPARKTPSAAGNFISENLTVASNFAGQLTPGEISDLRELKRGEGAIMREGLTKIAVFRDARGTVHRRSAICTHAGCLVSWNGYERCWDCSCHGSHFSPDGDVLNGPAMTPLAAVKREHKPEKRAAARSTVASKRARLR